MNLPTYERRGPMVYEEGTGREGSAKFVAECFNAEQAQVLVNRLNELTKAITTGSAVSGDVHGTAEVMSELGASLMEEVNDGTRT